MFATTATATRETTTDWRGFDDRDARQDGITRDLVGALSEPGF